MSLNTVAPLQRKPASTGTLCGKCCAQGHKKGHCVVHHPSRFGGLVVSVLASGTQVRGFKPG
jgi:hypothetical protein